MDIVARMRQGVEGRDDVGIEETERTMNSAADTIEFLRTEVDRLGDSLNKCHAKLMQANCPVWDARNSEET